MKTMLLKANFLIPILGICLMGCTDNDHTTYLAPSGTITFHIDHQVNGQPLKKNELVYTNAAGNEYLVTELKYFISDITFYRNNGTRTMIGDPKDIFYIDDDIPATKTLQFDDKIPPGTYDSITFIFGISEAKNKSFIFPDPPEAYMAWPEILGGGYHYMMMNGKWKDINSMILPFNFHLGIGQLYKGNGYNVDSIYAFVQNCFAVSLPGSGFTIGNQESLAFQLTMNIENWFDNPHVFDFDYWGGAIMQKQPAMQMAKENGWNVFTIHRW
jgi:hypothetical protein